MNDDEGKKALDRALSIIPKETVDKLSDKDYEFLKSFIIKTDEISKDFIKELSNMIKNYFLKVSLFFPSDNMGTLENDVNNSWQFFLKSFENHLLPSIASSLSELELSVDIENKVIKFKEDA